MREKINWKEIIKEGNIVKVRQWDDMAEEFGFTLDCAIDCFKKFTGNMREYCGETIRINENMEKKFNEYGYFYYEGSMFSTDMLEPYTVNEEEKEEDFMNRRKINWKEIIKAGNTVKIRQWDDMAKEYGEYYSANKLVINCSKMFTEEMKKYCGEIIEINKNMEKKFNECGYFYYEDYTISTDMLEPYMIIEEEREDLFMKIQEVMELKDGSRVRANNGKIYIVENGNLISEDNGNSLIVNYGLKEIFNMEFELIKVELNDVLIPGNIVEIIDYIQGRRKLGVILNNDNICYFDGGFDSLSYERDTANDSDYYINKVYEPLFGFDLININKGKMKLVWSKN